MKNRKLWHAVSVAICLACTAHVAAAEIDLKKLKQVMAERFSDIRIESVRESDWQGVYEVVTPTEIVYSNATGSRVLVGKMMDTKTYENLTELSWNEARRVDFNALPLEKAIKVVKGDGSRRLVVFSDPFCPYCQEFERNLKSVDDVSVYVFLYPLEDVHPGATEAARNIWCAPEPAQAWAEWMLEKKPAAENRCANAPIEALTQLGEKLNILHTPTLIFSDGVRAPGLLPVDRLLQRLGEHSKKSASR